MPESLGWLQDPVGDMLRGTPGFLIACEMALGWGGQVYLSCSGLVKL